MLSILPSNDIEILAETGLCDSRKTLKMENLKCGYLAAVISKAETDVKVNACKVMNYMLQNPDNLYLAHFILFMAVAIVFLQRSQILQKSSKIQKCIREKKCRKLTFVLVQAHHEGLLF